MPAVGLEIPVGVQARDHLDTQVYAYHSSSKTDSPRKEQEQSAAVGKQQEAKVKDKKVSIQCLYYYERLYIVVLFGSFGEELQYIFSDKNFIFMDFTWLPITSRKPCVLW